MAAELPLVVVPAVVVVADVVLVVPDAVLPVVAVAVVPVVAEVPLVDVVNALPTDGVTTVVTVAVVPVAVVPVVVVPVPVVPVVGVVGVPPGVKDACGGGVVGGVTGFPPGSMPRGAPPRVIGGPSGSTQFTFRLEQKSGIDVRSVDRSAAPATSALKAASAMTRVDTNLRKSFIGVKDGVGCMTSAFAPRLPASSMKSPAYSASPKPGKAVKLRHSTCLQPREHRPVSQCQPRWSLPDAVIWSKLWLLSAE